jgi:hypothetical protein
MTSDQLRTILRNLGERLYSTEETTARRHRFKETLRSVKRESNTSEITTILFTEAREDSPLPLK